MLWSPSSTHYRKEKFGTSRIFNSRKLKYTRPVETEFVRIQRADTDIPVSKIGLVFFMVLLSGWHNEHHRMHRSGKNPLLP
jgi:hypothetical protein